MSLKTEKRISPVDCFFMSLKTERRIRPVDCFFMSLELRKIGLLKGLNQIFFFEIEPFSV